jgi:DNA-directed RNA polymerase subunit alpha
MFDYDLYVEKTADEGERATFEIEPLTSGYGNTLGNSLRRVLLSSLEGAAIDNLQIDGVEHEFSPLAGVKEDAVELILNLKQVHFDLKAERATLVLNKKGPATVTAADFDANAECEATNKETYLCTLEKGGELNLRVEVVMGRGFVAVEDKATDKQAVGVITIDSSFSPVVSASYTVEKTRVGQDTNLDKVVLKIETDKSVSAQDALQQACQILVNHFSRIGQLPEPVAEEATVVTDSDIEPAELPPVTPKTKIEQAGLSSRTANALITAGYKTVSGLMRLSDLKLESIKGLGSKGLDEVKALLGRIITE